MIIMLVISYFLILSNQFNYIQIQIQNLNDEILHMAHPNQYHDIQNIHHQFYYHICNIHFFYDYYDYYCNYNCNYYYCYYYDY